MVRNEVTSRGIAGDRLRHCLLLGGAAVAATLVATSTYVALQRREAPPSSLAASIDPELGFRRDLAAIGASVAAGKGVPKELPERIYDRYAWAPLAPEPFLVRGVAASARGNELLSGRALQEARRRDPRSIPARFFLAEHYRRIGDLDSAIGELGALTRLVPDGGGSLVPQIAELARDPSAIRGVKKLLATTPGLKPTVMTELAKDAGSADLLMYLAGNQRPEKPAPAWVGRLCQSLLDAGEVEKARLVWSRMNGASGLPTLLFNPGFEDRTTGGPFNWVLASGADGVAEPGGKGQLDLLYYGRNDLLLAEQTLTLAPGSYRLTYKVAGNPPASPAARWRISCRSDRNKASASDLGAPGSANSFTFTVPVGCPAQDLGLIARASDVPRDAHFSISDVSLEALP